MDSKKEKTKTRPSIPQSVKTELWMKSGGRCQFDGCNIALWHDDLTYNKMNRSYIAHIYGYASGSARFHDMLSPQLEKDFSNLMLMCDTHHRLIDNLKKVDEFTAEKLMKMKRDHENWIEFITGIKGNKKSHIVLFGARIGEHGSPFGKEKIFKSILPDFYPESSQPIELGMKNTSFDYADSNYWAIEEANLINHFKDKIERIKANHEIQHFSIFGLAPIPLLIKLGTLLSDLYSAEIYQLHREPYTWEWIESNEIVQHFLVKPAELKKKDNKVVLKFDLSATITNDRVTDVLGEDIDIYSLTHNNPNNDYIRSKHDLQNFREVMRAAFDEIKSIHGQNAELHIFPAMPISTAIELGRIWMPKADLPMVIYDQNRKTNGFTPAIII